MQEIDDALNVLEENITDISTVTEWSQLLGFNSDRYFSRVFRNHFGERPKEVITKVKIEKIKECIAKSPDDIFYCIAKELGFIDDQALYKFTKRHLGMSPTELRKECEKGV